jgi:pyruvate kinase
MAGLIDAGMNVARMNFSHGAQADHEAVYQMVREAAEAAGKPVAILADMQGPKIRLGTFANGSEQWDAGDRIKITSDDVDGTHDRVSCTYKKLPAEVTKGDRLLVDDGKLALEVLGADDTDVECLVVEGGPVSNNKGLSLPNVNISVPALSEKDISDMKFALNLGVDLIAMSFVRSPEDARLGHKVMDEVGVRRPIIAKVEKPEAVARLEEIVLAFDGVMVARGDLGVEMPLDEVPIVQKEIVRLCRENAKPVIVATQMLDSMIENSRPTRAEASDVANAVLDGTDAVMLSGETSVGKYPVLTVSTMAKIISTTEGGDFGVPRLQHDPRTHSGALTVAASQIARNIGARALVAFSQTGDTVRRLSRLHCELPLYAFTPVREVRDQLAVSWGVETFLTDFVQHTDDMFRQVDGKMLGLGLAKPGDYVVVVAGSPPNAPGATNTLRVHQLGTLVDPSTV